MANDNSLLLSSLPPATAVPVINFGTFMEEMIRASDAFQLDNVTNTSDINIRRDIQSAFEKLHRGLRRLINLNLPLLEGQRRAGELRAEFINDMRGLLDLNHNTLTEGERYQIPDVSVYIDFERNVPLPRTQPTVSLCSVIEISCSDSSFRDHKKNK